MARTGSQHWTATSSARYKHNYEYLGLIHLDAENDNCVILKEKRKLRSRSHLTVGLPNAHVFFPIFYTFPNRITNSLLASSSNGGCCLIRWFLRILYHIDLSGDANRFSIGIVNIWTDKKKTRFTSNKTQFWTETDKQRKNKAENHTRLFALSMTRLLFGRTLSEPVNGNHANHEQKKNEFGRMAAAAVAAAARPATSTTRGSNCCLFSLCTSISRYKSDNIAFCFNFVFFFILQLCSLCTSDEVHCSFGWWLFAHGEVYVQIVE